MERLFRIIQRFAVVLLFIILFIYALSQARLLLYPLVLAVLFSYLLYPMSSGLEKKGVPRILANFSAILVVASIVGTALYIIYRQIDLLAQQLPQLKEQAEANIDRISQSVSSLFGMSASEMKTWLNEQLSAASENNSVLTDTILPSTTGTIMAIGLIPVYVFLLLYYRNKLYDFFMMVYPEEKHAKAAEVIHEISDVTRRYIGGVFIVVLILCVINTVGLLIIGLKFALLLGILSAVCNFIPYFGTLIGALFPLAAAFVVGDSPGQIVSVVIMFVIVQFTENNILTPNITGGSVQINPLVTIISLIAGGMVWGIPGMFSVVPIMGMLKIVLEKDERYKPFAYLLGTSGTKEHALTAHKIKGFFRIRKGHRDA
jgi:predicted PurR-regulated permease PerM